MAANLLDHPDRLLQDEIHRLRRELTQVWVLLEQERRKTGELEAILAVVAEAGMSPRGNVYSIDDDGDDDLSVAFDNFINHHDPHLDKVRSFLLDA